MFNFDDNNYEPHDPAEGDVNPQSDKPTDEGSTENTGSTPSESVCEPTQPENKQPEDATYHYGPSMQNNDANASRYPYGRPSDNSSEQPPYGQPTYGQQSSYNNPAQQQNQQPQNNPGQYTDNQQNNPGQYPYNQPNNQYPYQNNRGGYPYNRQDGNVNRNPYSNYGNQPPVPPKNNTPFYENNGKKNSGKGGKVVFGIMAAIICVLLIAVIVILTGNTNHSPDSTTAPGVNEEVTDGTEKTTSGNVVVADTQATPGENQEASTGDTLSPSDIYRKVHESSVGLLLYDAATSSLAGEGSGVAYGTDESGEYTYFITCAHVISESGTKIVVQTFDETKFDAEIVGYDTRTDIGVIRVKSTDFKIATFGDSSALSVGSPVYAIGNPGGTEFAGSFTNGIVSAIDRPIKSNTGYNIECIQHTAAINPGNSGGALVNAYGQVIGINSMKIVDDQYEGMGFAVPMSVAVPVVKDIVTYGYVANRPKLGISYFEAASYNYFFYYFVMSNGFGEGSIYVAAIADDSSFVGTQIKVGDIITEVNGVKLDSSDYLSDLVAKSAVGDKITLTVVRSTDNRNINQYDTFKITVKLVEDTGKTPEVVQEQTTQFDPFSYWGR